MKTHADRQRQIDAAVAWARPAVFETITSEHWRRVFARRPKNALAEQIRARRENFGTVNTQPIETNGR